VRAALDAEASALEREVRAHLATLDEQDDDADDDRDAE
jgi:hypothetical protein